MILNFIGANHQVTGSKHLLQAGGLNILIDCGMEQGRNPYETKDMPINVSEIDYILITHAHIDHTGHLPLIAKQGFNGTVISTKATESLCELMLKDSAHIQMMEAEAKNRRMKREGKDIIKPIYDLDDVNRVLDMLRGIDYGEILELNDSVSVRFTDAGHLLGSGSIEIFIDEAGTKRKLVFSGDIGNKKKPIIRDPQYIEEADYVIMESTYGNRLHEQNIDHLSDLVDITQRTLDRGGNVVIPAFAVGRTQELLYFYRQIKSKGLIKGHDGFPVYVDSPLAVGATNVFTKNMRDCLDDETREIVEKGINPISFKNLYLSITLDESKRINMDQTPKVIISASGMADAGRIRHHIKYNLWRPESSIVFAGYQAEGTLGRLLEDGARKVKLFGEDVIVRAEICKMKAMSSHADQEGLIEWAGHFNNNPRIFLVHGDDDAMEALKGKLLDRGLNCECPYSGSSFDLIEGKWINTEGPVLKKREIITEEEKLPSKGSEVSVRKVSGSHAFKELYKAYERLGEAVLGYREGANKDIEKFRNEIEKLYKRWKS